MVWCVGADGFGRPKRRRIGRFPFSSKDSVCSKLMDAAANRVSKVGSCLGGITNTFYAPVAMLSTASRISPTFTRSYSLG